MKILFISDIVGNPGRKALAKAMPILKREHGPDFIIANGENSAAGFGITESVMKELFEIGVNVITSGNHIWDKKEAESLITKEKRLLRPANYPPSSPGEGWVVENIEGKKIAVINLQGRVMMPPSECPFRALDNVLEKLRGVKIIVVDFHAEATSEKEAMGLYADGRVSAVIGTHTHVQTADERILPKGTAYISDAGMTGGTGGVIGSRYEDVMERFLSGLPRKLEPEASMPAVMGVVVEVASQSGTATSIKRVRIDV